MSFIGGVGGVSVVMFANVLRKVPMNRGETPTVPM